MKYLLFLIQYGLLLLAALLLSFLIWVGINDGRPTDRMITSALYFGVFSLLLVLALRMRGRARKTCILLLMLISPCLFLDTIMGDNGPRTFVFGRELLVEGWFGSVVNLARAIPEIRFGRDDGPYLALIACQLYSILLAPALTAILLRFNRNGGNLYGKTIHRAVAGAALVAGYLMIVSVTPNGLSPYFLAVYLPVYGLLWFLYVRLRRSDGAKNRTGLVLALVLLFPVVSILPGTVNVVTADTFPWYKGAIGVAPLFSALPFTLVQLIRDSSPEEQLWQFSVKLYTLLQAGIVLFGLPAALLRRTEDAHEVSA